MTCKLEYIDSKPISQENKDLAYDIHNNIETDLSKLGLKKDDKGFINSKDTDTIVKDYGNVLSNVTIDDGFKEKDYVVINALNSRQYLNTTINKDILGYDVGRKKGVYELSVKELIEQDTKISPLQFSDKMKIDYHDELFKDYDDKAAINKILKKDIVYHHVYTKANGEHIGLYQYVGEDPNYKNNGNDLESAKLSILKDAEVIINDLTKEGIEDSKLTNLETYMETLNYEQKVLLKRLLNILGENAPQFKIEIFDKLLENGDRAFTDFRDSVIQIGSDADFSDITEEIFHVIVEMLDPKLLESFYGKIEHTSIYREVVAIYGNDPRYKDNPNKLKHEAIVKLITQLSQNVPIENYMLTKDKSVLRSLGEAIKELLKNIYDLFKNVDRNDFFELTEAIMYNEVSYTKQDLTDRGQFASKSSFAEDKFILTSQGETLHSINNSLKSLTSLTIDPTALFDKDNVSVFGQELVKMVEALKVTGNEPNIVKIKLLKLDKSITDNFTTEQKAIVDNITILLSDVHKSYGSNVYVDRFTSFSSKDLFVHSLETTSILTDVTDSNGIREVDFDLTSNLSKPINTKIPTNDNIGLNQNRVQRIVIEQTPFEDSVKFFESLVGAKISNLMNKLSFRLVKDIERLQKLGINHPLDDNLVKAIRSKHNIEDFRGRISALYGSMEEFNNLFKTLAFDLNNMDDLTLHNYSDIFINLKSWNFLIEEINLQLAEEAKKGNVHQKFSEFIAVFESNRNNLQRVLNEKIAKNTNEELYRIVNKFNEALENNLQSLDEKYMVDGVIPERARPLYEKARDGLVEEYNKKKVTHDQLYSMLTQDKGQNDIDTGINTWNLIPLFDRYLVNVRFANDPVLASFGRMLDEIYNSADVEFSTVLDTFVNIASKVKEEGGEVKVGKELTRVVDRIIYKKTKEVINGVEVLQFKPKKVTRLEYINKWGDRDSYKVEGYTPSFSINGETISGSYGALRAEIENQDAILEKISKDNKELVDFYTNRVKKLRKIKRDFNKKYFYKEYAQEYYEIEDNTLLKYSKETKIDLNELTKTYSERRELLNDKLTEKKQVKSQLDIIQVDGTNRQYFLELKAKAAQLTGEISAMYIVKDIKSQNLENTLARVFNSIRDQQNLFKDKVPNLNIFIRDFQLMLETIDRNDIDLINTLNDLIKTNGVIDTNPDVILNKITEFHRNVKKEASTDSLSLQLVMKFLEDSIWYKPTDAFYDERQVHYDTITEQSLILRNSDFVALVLKETAKGVHDNEMVIKKAIGVHHESESYFKALKEINDLDLNTLNIRFNSLAEIREADKNGLLGNDGYAILDLNAGDIFLSVLTKNGKPIKVNQNANNTIDELWKEIIDLTRDYRDKFGYVRNMSEEEKVIVQRKEQEIYLAIYDIMTEPNIKGIGVSDKATKELIKANIKHASESLDKLQHDIINEGYYDELQKVFSTFNYTSTPLFSKLASMVEDSKLFRKTYWQNLQNLKQIIGHKDLLNLDIMSLEEANTIIAKINETEQLTIGGTPLYKLNEADLQILKFLKKNHVIKLHLIKFDKDGNEESEPPLVESYINRKVLPTNLNHVEKHFDNKYNSIIFNEITSKEHKDYRGEWKPLENKLSEILGTENEKLVDAYNDLQNGDNENLKDIYQTWVEDTHIAKQKEISIENPTRIAQQSYLGYVVPHMEKQYSELGWWEAIKAFWEELLGRRNPNESGEISFDTEEENKEKKKFLDTFNEAVAKFFNRTSLSYNKSRRYIPVDYTRHIEGSNNTENVFLASASYLSSLIKTNHINNNMFKISAVRNTLVNNNPYKEDGESYKRLNVINNTIDAEIYRNNLGDNNGLVKALRLVKKLLIVKTQTLASVAGWTKNLEAGLLQNYITSLNVPKNFYWNRLKKDTATTYKALQFAIDASRSGIEGETLTQYLARQLNPQHKNINELFRNSDRWSLRNLIFDGKMLFAGMKFGETIISYQLLLDVAQRVQFNTQADGQGEFVDFLDIFEKDGNTWNIKQGIYDKEGNQVDLSTLLEVKRLVDEGRFQTMGHSKFKGAIFNNTYVRSLFFFVNYLVPLMQSVTLNNRRDFVANRVVNNVNLAFLKYIGNTLKYLMNGRWYWNYMTNGQKQNTVRAIVAYTTLFGLVTILKHLFGFDPDDEDAYKKLKNNSWIENFALITVLKTASEIEQQSLFNPLSKTMLPVVTANWDAIRNPMLVRLITDLGKTAQLTYETVEYETGIDDNEDEAYYDKRNKQYGIEKGESKLLHALNKFNPIRDQNFNMGLQVQIYQQLSNR